MGGENSTPEERMYLRMYGSKEGGPQASGSTSEGNERSSPEERQEGTQYEK